MEVTLQGFTVFSDTKTIKQAEAELKKLKAEDNVSQKWSDKFEGQIRDDTDLRVDK